MINKSQSCFIVLAALALLVGCSGAASDSDSQASGGSGPSDVVVTFGGETLTMADIDQKSRAISLKPYQDLYDQRKIAIEQLIAERLIELAADERGITADELIEVEVTSKKPDLTDQDVEVFYNQNAQSMGGRPLTDELKVQIRQFLEQQSTSLAQQNLLAGLRADTEVAIMLEPPRVELTVGPDEPSFGPVDAPVTIVEYSDFQCPYCARVGPTLDQIKQAYGDKVRVVFRDFPLPNHPEAVPAAQAARCANEQDKFWEYHDKLFASQRELNADKYKEFAAELGLNTEEFGECVDSNKYLQDVQTIARSGQQAGVTGTPAFFVNGRFLSGAKPFDAFKLVIDEELTN